MSVPRSRARQAQAHTTTQSPWSRLTGHSTSTRPQARRPVPWCRRGNGPSQRSLTTTTRRRRTTEPSTDKNYGGRHLSKHRSRSPKRTSHHTPSYHSLTPTLPFSTSPSLNEAAETVKKMTSENAKRLNDLMARTEEVKRRAASLAVASAKKNEGDNVSSGSLSPGPVDDRGSKGPINTLMVNQMAAVALIYYYSWSEKRPVCFERPTEPRSRDTARPSAGDGCDVW